MDFEESDEVLLARGKYSTLSARQKALEKECQMLTQSAADHLRYALTAMDEESEDLLGKVEGFVADLSDSYKKLVEIRDEKDELRPIAWPK